MYTIKSFKYVLKERMGSGPRGYGTMDGMGVG